MPFTIDDFVNHIKKNGVQRSNRFHIEISVPEPIKESLEVEYNLQMMATNVDIPGVNVAFNEMHFGTGRKIAYDKSTGELNVTFRSNANMDEKKLFDLWIKHIFKSDHTVEFYANYIGTMVIKSLDNGDGDTYSVEVTEVYPITVTDISLDRTANDGVVEFQVTFAYRKLNPNFDEFYTYKEKFIPIWPEGKNPFSVEQRPFNPTERGSWNKAINIEDFPDVFKDPFGQIDKLYGGIQSQINKIRDASALGNLASGPAQMLLNKAAGYISRKGNDKLFPITNKINNTLDKLGFQKIKFPNVGYGLPKAGGESGRPSILDFKKFPPF